MYRTDAATGLVGRLRQWAGPIALVIRVLAGGTALLTAAAGLAYQHWTAAIVGAAIGFILLLDWPDWRPQRIGFWIGECPACATLVRAQAPPVGADLRFACPGCRRELLLKDHRFEVTQT
ncbi:hypothetical protein ACRAWG_19340 [Methylobacterium sp. P31]